LHLKEQKLKPGFHFISQGLKAGGFKLWVNWIQQLYNPTTAPRRSSFTAARTGGSSSGRRTSHRVVSDPPVVEEQEHTQHTRILLKCILLK
jgi:hypothetical protein